VTTTVPPPEPIGIDLLPVAEIADLAGVQRNTVEQWRSRLRSTQDPFPEPDDYVGSIPLWRLPRILAWLEIVHRPAHVEQWREKRDAGGYRRPTSDRITK
jgi:hypothetical protein